MHVMFCRALQALCASSLVVLAGCAGTASGSRSSALKHDTKVQLAPVERAHADALVVLRYPAMVEQGAENAFYRAFEANAIGGKVPTQKMFTPETERVAKAVVAKTNYYVMSVYKELQARLPPGSVLLSPHLVTASGTTGVSSRPILGVEEIPAVLTVDYLAYSFPDAEQMMDSPPLTFGDMVTSLVVIHADKWASPETNGLLLASEPLLNSAWSQAKTYSTSYARAVADQASPGLRPLDFMHYLTNGAPAKVPTDIPRQLPGTKSATAGVIVYPVEKIRMDSKKVMALVEDPTLDPFAERFAVGAATQLITLLNRIDADRATMAERHQALSAFDPEIAAAQFERSDNETVRARLQLAERLVGAQRDFFSLQSTKVYSGAYEGEFGRKTREMLVAEQEMLTKRRELASTQNANMFFAVLGAAAAGYSAGQAGAVSAYDPAAGQSLMNSSNQLMMSSLLASNDASSAAAESAALGENFLVAMAPAISDQISIRVDSLEGTVDVTASTYDEFQKKLLALYQQQARSVERSAEAHCAFRVGRSPSAGRWFGACVEGLASGKGYGIVFDGQTELPIEYLGSTTSGLPAGVGQLIVTQGDGAFTYEGTFAAGHPNGIVLVSTPGKKTVARTFEAGVDKGKANAKLAQRLAL